MNYFTQQTPRKNIFRTRILHMLLLLTAALVLVRLSVPDGCLFGSETDWFCQHVTIADYMRKQFYTTGNLFPDWSGLGCGSNFYDLSYYGFLRPDILISYFLPGISTETIIQAYAIGEIILGACLLYLWLCCRKIKETFCLTAALLYLSSNCLFQAHRQIMFVNYLPFSILAFWSIDTLAEIPAYESHTKTWFPIHTGLAVSLFLVLIHSFYFFPSCFAACTLYFFYRTKKNRRPWKIYLASVTLSVSLAMFLLLPTGLAILENKKDVKATATETLLSLNPSMNSLLYSAYGCGLTVLCLYTLLLSIARKKTRCFAIALCILFSLPVCYWILNGTLYARPKSLIPFQPLILLLTARTLEELSEKRLRHSLPLALASMMPVLVQIIALPSNHRLLLIADLLVLLGYVLLSQRTLLRRLTFRRFLHIPEKWRLSRITPVLPLALCIVPFLLFLQTAKTDTYVSSSVHSREAFSRKEFLETCRSSYARTDLLEAPMTNTNYAAFGSQNKSTLYSSVSNSSYNHFFYDILKMPVSIRNRVAMTGDVNPFQEYLLGIRYLQTTQSKLPAGYEIRRQKGEAVLAENSQVLPLAYGSTSLLKESSFDALSYPQNLDTLMNRTIVPDTRISEFQKPHALSTATGHSASGDLFQPYQSKMEPYPLPEHLLERPETDRETTVTRSLPTPVADAVLLLSFDIDYHGKRDVSVTVNGIRNCLSGSNAPYPNRNTCFTYMLTQDQPLTDLKIHFSKGNYKIRRIRAYTLPLSAFSHPGIVPFTYGKSEGKELLHGTLDMKQDGCFVTSFAYSNGYQAFVDGKKVQPIKINKAFVGFPLKAGHHEITLSFRAPGKSAGCCISLLALCYLLPGCLQGAPAFTSVSQVRRRKKLPEL